MYSVCQQVSLGTDTLYRSYTDPSSNTLIDFFQLNVTKFQAQIYPNLSATNLVGYNGMSPGPTFKMKRGRQSVVRSVNQNGSVQCL
jgi:bilirubin oxidase